MQQQIAAAGGTPGALETPTGGADATSAPDFAAEQTGSVMIRVFTCPAEMSQARGQGELDQTGLPGRVPAPGRSRATQAPAHPPRRGANDRDSDPSQASTAGRVWHSAITRSVAVARCPRT